MLLDQNMQGLYCRNLKRPFVYRMRCGYGQRFLSVTACHNESISNSDQVNPVLSGWAGG